jgi:hypothetical protein
MGSCSGFRVYWITAHADAEVKVQWVLAQGLGFIGLQHIQMWKSRCNGFLAQGLGFIGLQHMQMQKSRCNGFLLRV